MGSKISVSVWGLDTFVRDMRYAAGPGLDHIMQRSQRDIAEDIAEGAAGKARSGSRQLAAVAGTFAAEGDEVVAGGGSVVTSSGATGGDIYFGADFGSNNLKQFPASKRGGRTIFPTIREMKEDIENMVFDPLEDWWDN